MNNSGTVVGVARSGPNGAQHGADRLSSIRVELSVTAVILFRMF